MMWYSKGQGCRIEVVGGPVGPQARKGPIGAYWGQVRPFGSVGVWGLLQRGLLFTPCSQRLGAGGVSGFKKHMRVKLMKLSAWELSASELLHGSYPG